MKKTILILIIIFILSTKIIDGKKFLPSPNTQKSQPYSEILKKAKYLMGVENENNVENKLQELLTKDEQEIIDYFVNNDDIQSVKDYWLKYYLLAKLVLFTDKTWTKPEISAIDDINYQKILDQQAEYAKGMQTCKNSSNYFLEQGLSENKKEQEQGKKSTLKDYEYNYKTLEQIENDRYYQHIYKYLPKGIIHHIHWSASIDYKGFYESLLQFINAQPVDDKERVFIVSVRLYLEDLTVSKRVSEKYYTKFFLTKQKYVDARQVDQVVEDNQDGIDEFNENVVENGQCLNYLKDDTAFNPNAKHIDMYLKGFLYLKSCSGMIYSDDNSILSTSYSVKSLEDLKNTIKATSAAFQTDLQAIQELPNAYLEANKNETTHNQSILGIWYHFEQIFQSLSEFTNHEQIFSLLTDFLFRTLKEQNTLGIEFRNQNKYSQISNFKLNSDKYDIPFSFITPGRKISGKSSKVQAITSQTSSINNPAFSGIDFFGFEDDLYNGARNVFPDALSETLAGQTQSQFEQLFDYLNNSTNSIYLHAGETSYYPSATIDDKYASENYINDNILHAALLPNIKRVGHGFEAIKSNLLVHIFKRRNISFESCPISNEVLKFYPVDTNPFLDLLRSGVHVTISPDDPGIFGYTGVGLDWYYIMMNTNIEPSEIYLLLKYSIEHSSIKEIQKNKDSYLEKMRIDLEDFFNSMNTSCHHNL